MVEAICRKLGGGLHTSWRRAHLDILPSVLHLFRTDEEFQEAATTTFGFEEKELAYLLDEDEDSARVRTLAALRTSPQPAPPEGALAAFGTKDA